jgi:hypothetical protein
MVLPLFTNKKFMIKKLLMITCVLVSILSSNARAQAPNNIMTQPLWGPVGFDYVDYYYIPDLDAYYNVPGAQYIYREKKRWIIVKDMPVRYKDFNFYSAHKIVMNEPKPYMNYKANKLKYAQYAGQRGQAAIRESHDQKYLAKKDHPEHSQWISPQDVQDRQNRKNEEIRLTAQNRQDSLNRENLISNEKLHNAQEQLNKQQMQNNEKNHKH